jgi:uncharacterized membrane protein YesL
MTRMTLPDHGRRPRTTRPSQRTEQVRVAAETMAVGALFLLFSLPVVTIGAAWCAAAEVMASWHRGEEPALARTFAKVVRRDLKAGFVLQCAVFAVLAVAWFDIHVALGSRLPGYPVVAGVLAVLGAAATAFALMVVADRAAHQTDWATAIRAAAATGRSVPSTLVLVVTAIGFAGALIAVIPAFCAFMAGPLAYAVSVAVARGEGVRPPRQSPS